MTNMENIEHFAAQDTSAFLSRPFQAGEFVSIGIGVESALEAAKKVIPNLRVKILATEPRDNITRTTYTTSNPQVVYVEYTTTDRDGVPQITARELERRGNTLMQQFLEQFEE